MEKTNYEIVHDFFDNIKYQTKRKNDRVDGIFNEENFTSLKDKISNIYNDIKKAVQNIHEGYLLCVSILEKLYQKGLEVANDDDLITQIDKAITIGLIIIQKVIFLLNSV